MIEFEGFEFVGTINAGPEDFYLYSSRNAELYCISTADIIRYGEDGVDPIPATYICAICYSDGDDCECDGPMKPLDDHLRELRHPFYAPKFVNLTPHEISVMDGSGRVILHLPELSCDVPRLHEEIKESEPIGGIPVVTRKFSGCSNLPEEKYGTYYIVPYLVLQANPSRKDLVSPDTGPESCVRDENGKIKGVKRLQRWSRK